MTATAGFMGGDAGNARSHEKAWTSRNDCVGELLSDQLFLGGKPLAQRGPIATNDRLNRLSEIAQRNHDDDRGGEHVSSATVLRRWQRSIACPRCPSRPAMSGEGLPSPAAGHVDCAPVSHVAVCVSGPPFPSGACSAVGGATGARYQGRRGHFSTQWSLRAAGQVNLESAARCRSVQRRPDQQPISHHGDLVSDEMFPGRLRGDVLDKCLPVMGRFRCSDCT